MYSMVLMAALTTATDMPDFGRRGGCHGCWGGCYGCWGGCYGGFGWGCRGGCYGGGWGGCYGGGWGGGWGGCYGGCYGWGGGGYGGYAAGGWGGGYGGYAGWGGMGSTVYAAVPTIATPMLASNAPLAGDATSSMYYNPDPNAGRRATIVVHMPADAKLTVDGKATRATSAVRRFVTPPLESGQGYHYIFKAEIDRDGEPITVTKRVDVRAGANEEVTLQFTARDQSDRKRAPERKPEKKGSPDDKDKAENP